MDFIGVSALFMREKKRNMHFGSLIMITHGYYKESTKFEEFNSFHWDQYSIWGQKLYLMDLWMKHGKLREFLTQKPYLLDQVIAIYAILN